MKTIDLNCDVGEGIRNEGRLFPLISSCNISCGLHAGSDEIIKEVIDLALANNVVIGAHPSFDDRANFGRVEIDLPRKNLTDLVKRQVLKLKEMTELRGGQLHHVKPHGALYNLAAKSLDVSDAIVSVIEEIDDHLILFGMAESKTHKVANQRIPFVPEGFADRRYQFRDRLMSRNEGGLITDLEELKEHIRNLVVNDRVATPKGFDSLQIGSLCVHGDSPDAVDVVHEIRRLITNEGVEMKPAEFK